GGQRRAESPAENGHGEVPRDDQAHDADRLLEGHVDAAGNRDLLAEQALGRGRVVAQDVPYVARFPPGLAHRVPASGDPETRPRRRKRGAARPAGRGRPPARPPGGPPPGRSPRRSPPRTWMGRWRRSPRSPGSGP